MNGIYPLWSWRCLIAFVVAPLTPGVVYILLRSIEAAVAGRELLLLMRRLPEAVLGGALFSGMLGYPVAILIVVPIYGFVLTRLRRVQYWHFLLVVLLTTAMWQSLIGGDIDLTTEYQRKGLSGVVREIVETSVFFGVSTLIAITVFYWIVRKPVAEVRQVEAQ